MTDEEMAEKYAIENWKHYEEGQTNYKALKQAYLAGLKAGKSKWHKLDWKKDYPKLDRLVRVRTKYREEYICKTFAYYPTEDEIGYGHILTQFEQLDGDWVDDNEVEYWCYIEPFKE